MSHVCVAVGIRGSGRALAWACLVLTSLILAFVLNSTITRLSAAPEAAAVPAVGTLSPATAALADGDDIRARFIITAAADGG